MKKASILFVLGLSMCLLLFGYGRLSAQETQTSTEETTTAEAPASAAPAPEARSGDLPPVLEAEMTVAEHWSKNPYPRTVAAGARVHIVERGDTLWDLAQRYYNNPFLWPQIWDANKYIPNAHWIYPGDPIVVPPLTPITEEKMAEETSEQVPEETPGPTGPAVPAPEKRAFPIALDQDLYCSGFITHKADTWTLRMIGNEQNYDKVSLSQFDIVYINQGEAEGISPGDEFTVVHKVRSIEHPITLKPLGDYAVQTGRIKVVATQEHTATAEVSYSCDASFVGDYIVPFEPREVPVYTELPPVDRYGAEGTNAKGFVVFTKDDLGTVAQGNEIQIDLGAKDGITVGTRLVLYRPNARGYEGTTFEKSIPRRVLGEMIIYSVQDDTATGRIIQMYDYTEAGDRVEVR